MFALTRESVLGESKEQDLVDFTELAVAAKQQLGYRVLANAQPLFAAMAELGIKPFSLASVEAYKRKMVFWTNLKNLIATLSILFCRIALAISIVGGVLSFVIGGIWTIFAPIPEWCLWWFGASLIGFVGAGLVELYRDGEDLFWRYAQWNKTPIYKYPEFIPEFAVQTAVDLKEKCPEAYFYIEELRIEGYPILDPFLVVKHGDLEYHLEVWNEPCFKDKRQA